MSDLSEDEGQWIVNDNGELGVKIGEQFFFCYKGRSLVYKTGCHDNGQPCHDNGQPMHWRPVFKREFGECIHPLNYEDLTRIGTVSLADSDDWKELPKPGAPSTEVPQDQSRSTGPSLDDHSRITPFVEPLPVSGSEGDGQLRSVRVVDGARLRNWRSGGATSNSPYPGMLHDASTDEWIPWRDLVLRSLQDLPEGTRVSIIVTYKTPSAGEIAEDDFWELKEPHEYRHHLDGITE